MKKWTLRLAAVFFSLAVWAVGYPSAALTIENGFGGFYDVDGLLDGFAYIYGPKETVEIVGYVGEEKTVNIPEMIDGHPVTYVYGRAFAYNESIQSVTFPDSVTKTGHEVFLGCANLKKVRLPEGLACIEQNTFMGCTSLESVSIPKGLVEIGNFAFDDCTSLRQVELPDTLTFMGQGVFENCAKLEEISIPERIVSIEDSTFYKCVSLKRVNLKEGILYIGQFAFAECTALQSVTVPESTVAIGYYAFGGCSSLQDIQLPNGLRSVGTDAFSGTAYEKDDANWEAGVLYIGPCLIESSRYFGEQCVIRPGTTLIAAGAFEDQSALSQVTIPDSVLHIGLSAFSGTALYNNKENWVDGALYIDRFLIAVDQTTRGVFNVAPGTMAIAGGAFMRCDQLTGIILPDSVKAIGGSAFWGCAGLTDVQLPESVTYMSQSLFEECTNLRDVRLPAGLQVMEGYAFRMCTALQHIVIPAGVKYIGVASFADCSSLQAVAYGGTTEQWATRCIAWANEPLLEAELLCAEGTTLEAEGVRVHTAKENVGEGSTLQVETEEITAISIKLEGYTVSKAVAYDLSLADDAVLEGYLTTSLPLANTVEGATYRVFYVNADGMLIQRQAVEENGAMVFEAFGLGQYVLLELRTTGDVDGDGKITSTDARLVLQLYVGKIHKLPVGKGDFSDFETVADVDRDGAITSTDARLILQLYAGKIDAFPVA